MKSLALLILLLPALLLADGHEEIGVRKPIIAQPTETGEKEQEAHCGFIFDRYPQVYFASNVHSLVAISALGDSVEIEDGSTWKVSAYDGYKALNWRTTDPIMITQNNRWFSTYAYRIVNRNSGTSIEANLFLGPIKNGQYSRYIQEIDLSRGILKLNDNTHWEIASNDQAIFREWMANDSMIIGYNSGWDSSCEGLLINVTMNNSARARQF
jgi:hypothetical protein